MEYIDGVKISDIEGIKKLGLDIKDVNHVEDAISNLKLFLMLPFYF